MNKTKIVTDVTSCKEGDKITAIQDAEIHGYGEDRVTTMIVLMEDGDLGVRDPNEDNIFLTLEEISNSPGVTYEVEDTCSDLIQ